MEEKYEKFHFSNRSTGTLYSGAGYVTIRVVGAKTDNLVISVPKLLAALTNQIVSVCIPPVPLHLNCVRVLVQSDEW
jgi:hypothetical protein